MLFLSTPSARRATYDVRNPLKLRQISIHTLREEGDLAALEKQETPEPISIHALREEGDPRKAVTGGNQGVFLSTPSARRATL